MGKKIFWIIVLLLIAYATWSFINVLRVKIRYGSIVDQAKAIVKYTPNEQDSKILRKLIEKAEETGLKITEEDIELYHDGSDLSIYITYADSAVFPFGLKTIYYDQEIDISKQTIKE
jgi:phosphoribosyl-ATP pyrophosphohydrolase